VIQIAAAQRTCLAVWWK